VCWSLDWVWSSEDRLGGGCHEPSPVSLILRERLRMRLFLHFSTCCSFVLRVVAESRLFREFR